jgi:hypothetical protein
MRSSHRYLTGERFCANSSWTRLALLVTVDAVSGAERWLGQLAGEWRTPTWQKAARTSAAVARAKDGDRDAVRFLYERYARSVRCLAYQMVRDLDAAEDVTQDVFVRLLPKLDLSPRRTHRPVRDRAPVHAALDSLPT